MHRIVDYDRSGVIRASVGTLARLEVVLSVVLGQPREELLGRHRLTPLHPQLNFDDCARVDRLLSDHGPVAVSVEDELIDAFLEPWVRGMSLKVRCLVDEGGKRCLGDVLSLPGIQAGTPRCPQDLAQVGLDDDLDRVLVAGPDPCRKSEVIERWSPALKIPAQD